VTIAELVERSKRLAGAGSGSPDAWAKAEIDLAACVQIAIHELANDVMRDPERRAWLQQKYTVQLDGAGESTDLLTANGSITGQAGEIILEGINLGAVIDADGNVLVYIPHYADFLRPQPTAFAYYHLKDRKVITRAINAAVNSPFDIQSVSGPLTITCNFAPKSVTDIPLQLEDDLVKKLVTVVMRKIETLKE
jgi:hypothetical protein